MPNTALPVITGTATEGQLLTVSNGTWTNSPTSYTKQWMRCDAAGVNCVLLPSATGSTYVLTAADVGKKIRCWVSAFNAVGASAAVETAATAVIAALTPAIPVLVTAPAISGTPTQGNTLTVSNGAWTNSPTSYTRQWRRCDAAGANGVDIAAATAATYVLVSADVAKTIRCVVTALNASGSSSPATTTQTALVAPPAVPVNTVLPVLAGNPFTGSVLSSGSGAWTNAPTSYTYQWRRCNSAGASCADISAATSSSYTLVSADVGSTIRCVVKAVNAAGTSAGATSAASIVVGDWTVVATEHQSFTLTAAKEVRYGANGIYSPSRVLAAGTYDCDNFLFPDPLLGATKQCETRGTAQPPTPPSPPASGPITITAGGTYVGNWKSTTSAPTITIATAQAVIIQDSVIEKTVNSTMIATTVANTNVTIRRTTFKGPVNGVECRINPTNFAAWTIQNCTIDKTGGFYFQGVPTGTVLVSKCRARNIQGDPSQFTAPQNYYGGRSFVQFNGFLGSSAIVEWCEVISDFGSSFLEDVVSGYNSNNVTVRNNFFWGGYPPVNSVGYSGSGFVFGEGGGSNNTGHDNQLVALMNVGCGIVGGTNNHIYNTKVVCSGRIPNGTICQSANNGIVIYGIPNPATANNTIYNCVTGAYIYQSGSLVWNPWWSQGGAGASNNFYGENTQMSQPVTVANEQAEYPIWVAKLVANGITIGA